MSTKVIQSYREHDVPHWILECLASVRHWAAYHEFDYEFVGDTLLDRVPGWYRQKAGTKIPVVTDLARLLWTEDCLAHSEAETVVWLDADTFIFAPDNLSLHLSDSCVLGQEYWLQLDKKGNPRLYNNVHNAFCAFQANSPVLPFLIYTIERLMRDVSADFIAPQFVGPKLLTSLHNTVRFAVDPRFGAVSPMLADALVRADADMLKCLGERSAPVMAANLSHSLVDQIPHAELMGVLRGYPSGF